MNPGDTVTCAVCRREGQIPARGEDHKSKRGDVYVCRRCQAKG